MSATDRDTLRRQRLTVALALLDAAPAEHARDADYLLGLAGKRLTTGHDARLVLHRVAFDNGAHDAGRLLTGLVAALCGGDERRLAGCPAATRAALVGYTFALLAHRTGRPCHCPASAAQLAADLAAMPVRVESVADVPAALAEVERRRVA